MKLLFAAIILVVVLNIGNADKKVVCYHGTWSTYRTGNGKFDVEKINPYLCTHLVYTFFGIEENGGLRIIDPYLDLEENWGRGNIKRFNNLKEINPKLKTLAAVGGWNEGSIKFSDAAKDPVKRQRFIRTSVDFILKHKFDGLDLDWEYPAQRGGDVDVDKNNFVIFIKEIREELSKYNLLFTAAVASAEFSASISYDIPQIMKYFDFVNVMAYDLHGAFDEKIGINAPMFEGPQDVSEKEKQLNVHAAITYWLKQGAPAEKLTMGLATYGRTFTLSDISKNSVGSPHKGAGKGGRYSKEPGMIGYNELCEEFQSSKWTIKWEPQQLVPYAFRGDQWIGYDDARSLELKVGFAKKHNLGGVMVWAVETDDFNGECGHKYPLLKMINKVLNDNETIPSTTLPPTSSDPSTTLPPTSSDPSTTLAPTSSNPSSSMPTSTTEMPISTTTALPEFKCTNDGFFEDVYDCAKFYRCVLGIKYTFYCKEPLVFDKITNVCNYPAFVDCSNKTILNV